MSWYATKSLTTSKISHLLKVKNRSWKTTETLWGATYLMMTMPTWLLFTVLNSIRETQNKSWIICSSSKVKSQTMIVPVTILTLSTARKIISRPISIELPIILIKLATKIFLSKTRCKMNWRKNTFLILKISTPSRWISSNCKGTSWEPRRMRLTIKNFIPCLSWMKSKLPSSQLKEISSFNLLIQSNCKTRKVFSKMYSMSHPKQLNF